MDGSMSRNNALVSTPNRAGIRMNRMRSAGLALVASLMMAGAAWAQTSPVEPYWAVITDDNTLMRSGFRDTVEYYPVAKLGKGVLVRIDGESKEWLQAEYPAEASAFVPFEAVSIDVNSATATLTKPSRLSAANINDGFKGSWRPLLASPLAIGTKLTLLEKNPVESTRGKAWVVAAPAEARGFVPTRSIRRLSVEEAASMLRAQGKEPAAGLSPMAKTEPARAPAPIPANDPNATPAKVEAPSKVVDLRDPTVVPANTVLEPTTTSAPATSTSAPSGQEPDTRGLVSDVTTDAGVATKIEPKAPSPATANGKAPVTSPTSATPRMNKYEGLESAFKAVGQQPVKDGEFSELIAEYEAAIAELPADRARLRTQLTQRLELLKIRADLQAQLRKIDEDRQAVSTERTVVEQRLADFEKARQYVVVGRLSASTIYDGVRLPLMYRVQAVGGASAGRTLAYMKPQDGVSADRFIGAIVGVVGQTNIEPTLKINIVTPIRIDPLEALSGAGVDVVPGGLMNPDASATQPTPSQATVEEWQQAPR